MHAQMDHGRHDKFNPGASFAERLQAAQAHVDHSGIGRLLMAVGASFPSPALDSSL